MRSLVFIKPASLLCMWLMLSGCNPFSQPESLTEAYLTRLARVLDHDISIDTINPPPAFPRPKDRRFELEPFKVNMLQFFSLFGCKLHVLAGEKNSILGKVMTPATRLDYELRFLKAAQTCLEQTRQEPELQTVIKEVVKHKQDQLPHVAWNAVWNTSEIANYMSYATSYFPIPAKPNISQAQALKKLNVELSKLLALDYSADMSVLLELQYQWQYDSGAGQLLKTIHMLTERFNQANQIMAKRLKKPICFQQKTNPKAERMKNFFFTVYIGKVQPYVAHVHQNGALLLEQLQELASFTSAPSIVFNQYQQSLLSTGLNSNWNEFDSAVMQHTKHWQALLEQCGMRPTS